VKFENDLETEILIKELDYVHDIPAGSLHWNHKRCRDKVFVKCSGSCTGKFDWVSFSEITLTGVGKVKAADLMTKFMNNEPYNARKNPFFNYKFF